MNITAKDLAKVIVFQNATEDDLQLILKNSIIRSIEEGGFFFFQGDSANYFYILTNGQALALFLGYDQHGQSSLLTSCLR